MSYNHNAFNRAPFNRSESGNVQWFDIDGYENVNAYVGISTEVYLFCIHHERVSIKIHGERFVQFTAEAHEVTGYNVALEGTFWIDVWFNERVQPYAIASAEMKIPASFEETISEDVFLGCHVSFSSRFSEIITKDIIWHVDYFTAASANELVSQNTAGISLEEIACVLKLTLMPGQRLIVDASNYNVLLDGVNMIHTQEGEWLDEISRETTSITVTAAAGQAGLSANILYTERFL